MDKVKLSNIDEERIDAEDLRLKQEIGERVRAERERCGYTQRDLSELAGVAIGTVTAAEQGRRAMTVDTVIAFANALKVSSDYILGLRPKNYDDVMADAKTAHLVRSFHRVDATIRDEVLWYMEAVIERKKKHGR